MSKQIFIQVSAPPGSGPFNLYTNLDYVTPFANVILPQLTGGYYAIVADNVTIIKIEPTGTCTTPIYVSIVCDVTTTTSTSSTTTTTRPPTTTTSTSSSTTTTTTHPPCMRYSVSLTSGDELTYSYTNCLNQDQIRILTDPIVYFCAYYPPIILDGVGVVALVSVCGATTTTSSTSSTTTTTIPGLTTTTTIPGTTTSTSTSTSTSTTSTSSTTTSTSSSTTTTTKPIYTTSTTLPPTTTTTIPVGTTTTSTISGSTTTTTIPASTTTTTTEPGFTTTTTSTPATTTTTTFGGTTTTTTVKPLPTTTTTTIATSPYDCTCYTLSSESLTGAGYTVFEYVDCATSLLTLTDEIFNNSVNICAQTGTVGIDFNSKDAEWNIQYTGGTAAECSETVDCNPVLSCTCHTIGVLQPGRVNFIFTDCNSEEQTIQINVVEDEFLNWIPVFNNICVASGTSIIIGKVTGDPDTIVTNNNVPCTNGVEGDTCPKSQCYTLYNIGEIPETGTSTVTYTYWGVDGIFYTQILNYQDVLTVCSQTYPEFTEQGYGLGQIQTSGEYCDVETPCEPVKYCNCVVVTVKGDPVSVTYKSCETGIDTTVTLGNGYDSVLAACMNGYPTIGAHGIGTEVIVDVSKDLCSTNADCNTCNCVTVTQAKPSTAIGVYYKECGTFDNAYGLVPELALKTTFTACMSNAYAPLIWNETDNVEAIENDDYVISTSGSCLTTNDCLPTTTTTTNAEQTYYYYEVIPFDGETCDNIGETTYIMRSTTPISFAFVNADGGCYRIIGVVSGPTYSLTYSGSGGNVPCFGFGPILDMVC